MKATRVLRLIGLSAVQFASNGREFKTAEFIEIVHMDGMGEVKTNKAASRRNLWNDFSDAEGRTFTADPLFKTGQLGDIVMGSIETFRTTPYHVYRPDGSVGPEANKRTLVIFEGEDAISYANTQLRRSAASVVDVKGEYGFAAGEITAPQNLLLKPMMQNPERLDVAVLAGKSMEYAEAFAEYHRNDIELRNEIQLNNVKEGKQMQQYGISHNVDPKKDTGERAQIPVRAGKTLEEANLETGREDEQVAEEKEEEGLESDNQQTEGSGRKQQAKRDKNS